MKNITTILFDVDGTLLNTNDFIIKATEHALFTLGYTVPSSTEISSHVGKPFHDFYFSVSGSEKDIERLIDIHREFQYNNFNLIKIFPNTKDVLKNLKDKKYKLGAVTSRSNKTSNQSLINADIFDFFEIVISSEDAKGIKPDPAPIFKALEHIGEKPENTIMVGDSHFDIEAGKNANTKTIRVTYGFHNDNLHNPEPDFFIDDISKILEILD